MSENAVYAEAIVSMNIYSTGFHDLANQSKFRTWVGIAGGVAVGCYLAQWLELNPPKGFLLVVGILAAIVALNYCIRIFYKREHLCVQTLGKEKFIIDNNVIYWAVIDKDKQLIKLPICRKHLRINRSEQEDKVYYEFRGATDKSFVAYGKAHFSAPYQEVIFNLKKARVTLAFDRPQDAGYIAVVEKLLPKTERIEKP